MRKINNKYLGNFYIEEFENREEQDRAKLFDSDENYLDYLPLERYDDTDPTEEEQYQGYIEMLESFKTIEELKQNLQETDNIIIFTKDKKAIEGIKSYRKLHLNSNPFKKIQ